jgi:ankyrin repeat protein
VVDFLENDTKVEASSQALLTFKDDSYYSQEFPRQMTALHLTAYFGAERATSFLLKKGVKADSTDSYARTPLSYAAEKGHEAVVKLLLATKGVNADSKATGRYNAGKTPLSLAAKRGHEAIVKLLLATKGVDADSKDSFGSTPLSYAAKEGHQDIVKLLLATKGVDANSKDNIGQTPLSLAAKNWHEAVVKLLPATEGS